jgi:tetratricopeptide (TPR) repeat protein
VSGAWLLVAAALAAPGRVVVVPPAGPDRGAPGWIGAAVEEALPRELQRAGTFALPAADRRLALEALGITGGVATRATGVRLADTLGARFVVFGSWDLGGGGLTLTLQPFDVAAAELRAPLVAKGPLEDLGRLVGELARELAGRGPAPPGRPAGAPFAALRALGEGLAARDPESRIQGVRRALALHPGYPEAALALARLLHDAARFDEARAVLAGPGAEPVFERERRFLDGACLLGLGRHAEADVLYAALAASEPTASVLANRAIARLRRPDAAGGASTLLRQALDRAPFASELPFGLGWAHFVEGDAEAAVFWLRDAVRYAAGDARARLALSWALRAQGRTDEADEQWRAAKALDASLESQRLADAKRRLERILPSEGALLLDPERRADPRRLLQER